MGSLRPSWSHLGRSSASPPPCPDPGGRGGEGGVNPSTKGKRDDGRATAVDQLRPEAWWDSGQRASGRDIRKICQWSGLFRIRGAIYNSSRIRDVSYTRVVVHKTCHAREAHVAVPWAPLGAFLGPAVGRLGALLGPGPSSAVSAGLNRAPRGANNLSRTRCFVTGC